MERIDKILNHNLFLEYLRLNEEAECDRIFCHHDMVHFLDVARIAWILNLEEKLGLAKEWIYAAALLHDIGRHIQYADGMPHEKASALLAPEILRDCGFDDKETDVIVSAIATHRNKEIAAEASLNGILYRADKASRPCFACKAEKQCDWKKDKKNKTIKW
ncbi:MAG: HD domain-containing protein [Lachnospiraceae bacterium]